MHLINLRASPENRDFWNIGVHLLQVQTVCCIKLMRFSVSVPQNTRFFIYRGTCCIKLKLLNLMCLTKPLYCSLPTLYRQRLSALQTIGRFSKFCEHSVSQKSTVWAVGEFWFLDLQWAAEQNKKINVFAKHLISDNI